MSYDQQPRRRVAKGQFPLIAKRQFGFCVGNLSGGFFTSDSKIAKKTIQQMTRTGKHEKYIREVGKREWQEHLEAAVPEMIDAGKFRDNVKDWKTFGDEVEAFNYAEAEGGIILIEFSDTENGKLYVKASFKPATEGATGNYIVVTDAVKQKSDAPLDVTGY